VDVSAAIVEGLSKPNAADLLKVEHVHKLTLSSIKNWNDWCLDIALFLSTNRIASFSAIACKKTTSGDALVFLEDHLRELKTYGKVFSGDVFLNLTAPLGTTP
jgi:hypothetical protein